MDRTPTEFRPDPGWLRRIACISTGRADAGIYHPLIEVLARKYEIFFLAGGTHLSSIFGNTIRAIAAPPGVHVVPIDHFVEGDQPHGVCQSTGRAVEAFSAAIAEMQPDLVFVLGDRPEMLAAALAVTIHAIPMAHLHGGEITAGAYDDACRNAITKLSHLHFVATEPHGERVVSMNEDRCRVHVVGAPALDALPAFSPLDIEALSARLNLNVKEGLLMLVFHPETLAELPVLAQIDRVLEGIRSWKGPILIVGSNADVGYGQIAGAMQSFMEDRSACRLVSSLSQDVFWSCLAHARLLVGNSSAGLLEAPSFALPVINIGERQCGRMRAANVIDVPFDAGVIRVSIEKAASDDFRRRLAGMKNPYGDGDAAARIIDVLVRLPSRRELLIKNALSNKQ